jgi:hypothetical protein
VRFLLSSPWLSGLLVPAFLFVAGLAYAPPASAQLTFNTTTGTLLAKATADECYAGLGLNSPGQLPPCGSGLIPKVNQAYVWSLAETADDVWFGTTANALCTTAGTVSQGDIGVTPYQTPGWACEFGSSPYSPPYAAPIGDMRPPRIYVFNKTTKVVTDITPRNAGPNGAIDSLLALTQGLRAAVVVGNHVIFAGPNFTGGLSFFGFDVATKQWVAKGDLKGYINIRSFLTVDGVVYAGVGRLINGGSVLRYTGSFESIPPPTRGQGAGTCPDCFSFDTVGFLDSDAANLALHNGRVFVSTWPNGGLGGIYMGPPVPTGGYTRSNMSQWLKVWDANLYEADPAVAKSYGGGALASFGGYLYWGTINVPFASFVSWVNTYGAPTTEEEAKLIVQNTFRTIAIFRAQGFETQTPAIDLLYGATAMQAYTPPGTSGGTGTWASTPNKMPQGPGTPPLYGNSGFNNLFNVYTWSMAIWQNKLWVGTFDYSWPQGQTSSTTGVPPPPPVLYGADLWVFNNTTSPAVAENTKGLGNITSYGVRNMLPSGNLMYVGMANNANLLANPATPPNGGWELLVLQPKP